MKREYRWFTNNPEIVLMEAWAVCFDHMFAIHSVTASVLAWACILRLWLKIVKIIGSFNAYSSFWSACVVNVYILERKILSSIIIHSTQTDSGTACVFIIRRQKIVEVDHTCRSWREKTVTIMKGERGLHHWCHWKFSAGFCVRVWYFVRHW